jgi:C-3',4' desaturase CrtD
MTEIERYDAIVVGAGVAGLTAAAELTCRKVRTLVVERHNVPGGCASFYQRDGYRFDVGATLIGGFGARGVHRILNARLGIVVSPEVVEPSMVVHFPDEIVVRYGDQRWHSERVRAFGTAAEPFFRRQERIADLAWDLSTRAPALPADIPGAIALGRAFRPRHGALLATLGRTVASIMPAHSSQLLRSFVDAQLLITAQSDAAHTDLAYGATALDLAREGTFHLADGVSTISVALARAVRRQGSDIMYNSTVREVEVAGRAVRGVVLDDGRRIACRRVVIALPLHDAVRLAPELAPAYRGRLAAAPQHWGAFTVYVGLPPGIVPEETPSHHQVVASYAAPLGEGNTTFLSFSGPRELRRARNGGRAVTISTHTDVARWERAQADGREPSLRAAYTAKLLAALDSIIPGASARATLIEPATPHTFARYTGRHRGLVGGLPQTPSNATIGALSHHTPIAGLYLAGDETFPGQSTVGTTLSGLAAARAAAFGL